MGEDVKAQNDCLFLSSFIHILLLLFKNILYFCFNNQIKIYSHTLWNIFYGVFLFWCFLDPKKRNLKKEKKKTSYWTGQQMGEFFQT